MGARRRPTQPQFVPPVRSWLTSQSRV